MMQKRLLELEKMAGRNFVTELVVLLLTESEERLHKINDRLRRDEFPEAEELFHQVQGSAAATGAGRLRRISALGQRFSKKSDGARAQRSAKLLAKELDTLKVTLEEWNKP